jgi:hypothetical protein
MAKFIISDHRFHEHESFFQAQGELARLRALNPDRDYQIYRCAAFQPPWHAKVEEHC